MTLAECLRQGFLKKIDPDLEKSDNSIKLAEHKLELAKNNYDADLFEDAFVNAYSCMFHAVRALMSKDGYKERGHFVLSIYLKERYGDKIERRYINEIGSLRSIRHDILYGKKEDATIREVQETEAHSAIAIAEGFLQAVKKLLH